MQNRKNVQNAEIVCEVTALGTNAEGICETPELRVFVPFVNVGERVRVRLNYCKGGIAYGDCVEVLSPNHRVVPRCSAFGKCGGCQLQQAQYDAQLRWKARLIRQNLKKIGGIDQDVSVVASTQWGYRNKLQMPFGIDRKKVVLGFYRTGSHELVPMESCPLQSGWEKALIRIVCEWANENHLSVYREKTHRGCLRHLVARYLNGQLSVTVVVNGESLPNAEKLYEKLLREFPSVGLFRNRNVRPTNVILGGETEHLFGQTAISAEENGIAFQLQPDSFYQVNEEIKTKLYRRVKELLVLSQTEAVIDAFSGIGLLSAALYGDYEEYAVEIVPSAVADANAMKQKNRLSRLTNVCGDVNEKLPQIFAALKGKKTALVVDPPRKGLSAETIEAILQAEPVQMVYISCDSATLARDLKGLSTKYEIASVEGYDMFPNTRHVETVVSMFRKDPKRK